MKLSFSDFAILILTSYIKIPGVTSVDALVSNNVYNVIFYPLRIFPKSYMTSYWDNGMTALLSVEWPLRMQPISNT